jgi:predicted nucleic acid-binding protein
MPLVIDASVTMCWFFDDQASPAADRVLDLLRTDHAVVPSLWNLEVANVLLVAERRRRATEAQVARFADLLTQLQIHVDSSPLRLGAHVDVGRRHGLSAYDAAYLALAERLGLPVATLHDKLAVACRSAGVPLLIE